MTFSRACEAGLRGGIIAGDRISREDLWVISKGKKALRVVKGARRWLVRVSSQVSGGRWEM